MAKTGSFDLNFPGARMVCDSPLKRASLLSYINGERNSYDVELSYKNLNIDVQNAIYNTTYIHECKHFHDHLLCPYLLHNYVLKIVAFYYSLRAMYEWNNGKKFYKWIPIPFVPWLKMPFKEKLEILKKKGLNKKEVPFFSLREAMLIAIGKKNCKDNFTEYLLTGAVHYAEYIDNTSFIAPDGEKTDFSLKSFTESMAYIQHLTEIFLRYGKGEGKEIGGNILSYTLGDACNENLASFGHSEYTAAFSMVARLEIDAGIDNKYYYPFESYALFWSLCGPLRRNSQNCIFPRNRLEGLYHVNSNVKNLGLDRDEVMKDLFFNPFETFEKWDDLVDPLYSNSNEQMVKSLNYHKIEYHLKKLTFHELYTNSINKMNTIQNKLISLGLTWPSFYVYNIVNSLYYMSTIFCAEPGRYLYPEEYSKNVKRFANVPYRFEFNGVEPITEEECKTHRKGISFINDCVYGDSLITDEINLYTKKMDYRTYEASKEYIDFSDALYGSSNINMPGMLIKKFLPGINTWFY